MVGPPNNEKITILAPPLLLPSPFPCHLGQRARRRGRCGRGCGVPPRVARARWWRPPTRVPRPAGLRPVARQNGRETEQLSLKNRGRNGRGLRRGAVQEKLLWSSDFITDMRVSVSSDPHVSGKVIVSMTVEDLKPQCRRL